jgi:hypothetical protein
MLVRWRDERVAGSPRYSYLPEGDTLTYIPKELLKSVVFLGYKDSTGEPHFIGSAFWVSRAVKDEAQSVHWLAYLVTARHVIEEGKEKSPDGHIWLRVNTKENGQQWVAESRAESWATHRDPTIDIAILKIALEGEWDHFAWPIEASVRGERLDAQDWEGDRKVELGDELVFAGLFYPHEGKTRNIPVARTGKVSAMRDEPVANRKGKLMDVYLVETLSIGGLSGAPVFIDIISAKTAFPPASGAMAGAYNPRSLGRFKLFGLIHGHFGKDDSVEDATAVADDGDEKIHINLGIAMVVPAEKIDDVIARFADQERVEMEHKAEKKNMLVVPDSMMGTRANVTFQTTGTGFEIPVPEKDQVLRDLTKASRKKD